MSTSDANRPDDETIAEPFDQTNGMVPEAEGESDGTAASDTASAGDREDPLRQADAGGPTEGDRGVATATAGVSMRRTG